MEKTISFLVIGFLFSSNLFFLILLIKKRRGIKKFSFDHKSLYNTRLSQLKTDQHSLARSQIQTKKTKEALFNRIVDIQNLMILYNHNSETCKDERFYLKSKKYVSLGSLEGPGMLRDIIECADVYLDGIVEHLLEQSDRLTREDLIHCSMICLGFSNELIQLAFGYKDIHNVYNRSCRIRDKLTDNKSIKLEFYLREEVRKRLDC